MDKNESILYLNTIKPYINLKAICDDYNEKNSISIDYNNLRAVLNGVSETRLSEGRLISFIDFLYNDLYLNIFDVFKLKKEKDEKQIKEILTYYVNEMSNAIVKELNNGFLY